MRFPEFWRSFWREISRQTTPTGSQAQGIACGRWCHSRTEDVRGYAGEGSSGGQSEEIGALTLKSSVKFLFDSPVIRITVRHVMSNLTPADIISWFKSKSREYAQTAARLERDFNMPQSEIILSNTNPAELPAIENAPLQSVLDYLKMVGAKRPADIAEHIKSTKEAVLATIAANPDKFSRAPKGWIKLIQKEDPMKDPTF